MPTTTTDPLARVEELPPGAPLEAPYTAAKTAIDAELAVADEQVFPAEHVPTSADARVTHETIKQRYSSLNYGDTADDHELSVRTWPELSRLFRHRSHVHDVGDSAASYAGRVVQDPDLARAAAIARYKRRICEQLAAFDGHELQPAARAYLAAVARAERLEAIRCHHEAHARAQAEQLALEQRARERAEEETRIAADTERELKLELVRRGLPENLGECELVSSERARIQRLARVRARLLRSKVDGVRLNQCLYSPGDLGRSLGRDVTIGQLDAIDQALDRAEQLVAQGCHP